MKRLKLYDTTIRSYVSNSDRKKFKKIAYKNEMTISDLNRQLIKLVIKLDEMDKLSNRLCLKDNDLDRIINSIGGVINSR